MKRQVTDKRAAAFDAELQRDVLEEISWDPSIDASQITVTAIEGVVTLKGHVQVYAEKHAAEEVAKHVHGVRAIANEIEVVLGDSLQRDDAEIAAAALVALDWHSKVPHERVQVIVDHGRVTLEGEVDWQFQKIAIEHVVRHLNGVQDLNNRIEIKARETNDEVNRSVESALKRNARLRVKDINVETENGVVTLTGDVHSLAERDAAERMAWSGRGIQRVENCITVTPWGDGPAEEWGY
jgi:osmotically-inducible protein OsmY